jgi:heme A synthase
MSGERRLDSFPLRVALGILCAITCYFGAVFAIALALPSEPVLPRQGSRPADLRAAVPNFVFDYSARIDFERRITAQHTVSIVAVLGVVAVALMVRSVISRYRSWRNRRPPDTGLPQWMIQ